MAEAAFCVICRARSEVMDTYLTDDGDRLRSDAAAGPGYLARPLACGHDAGDGGGQPYRSRPVDDRALVEEVDRLQRGHTPHT